MGRSGIHVSGVYDRADPDYTTLAYRLAVKTYSRCNKALYKTVDKKVKSLNTRLGRIAGGKIK